jgi:recombination protein RecA
MAKAKEEKTNSASVENILKKYGDIVTAGTGLLDKKTQVFPISPSIDFAIGGGVPEGSFVSISGPPGCGKSTTTLQLIANCQRPEFYINGKPRKIFYADVEHRLKPMNMRGVVGLNPEGIQVIKSTKEHILSAQEFLDVIEALIKDPENEGCIVVVDSSSALCPADEMVAETSGQIRSTQPKIMAHWCRKMAGPVKVMSATVIMIQHLITNTSGYGEKWQVDGGEKLKFQLDVNITTRNKPEDWEEDGAKIGQIVEWKVIKSAMGQSGNTARSCLRYGKGLDAIKETFILGVDLGIINKAGAWFSFDMNGETIKTQGEAKMCAVFAERFDVYSYVRLALAKYMGGSDEVSGI